MDVFDIWNHGDTLEIALRRYGSLEAWDRHATMRKIGGLPDAVFDAMDWQGKVGSGSKIDKSEYRQISPFKTVLPKISLESHIQKKRHPLNDNVP